MLVFFTKPAWSWIIEVAKLCSPNLKSTECFWRYKVCLLCLCCTLWHLNFCWNEGSQSYFDWKVCKIRPESGFSQLKKLLGHLMHLIDWYGFRPQSAASGFWMYFLDHHTEHYNNVILVCLYRGSSFEHPSEWNTQIRHQTERRQQEVSSRGSTLLKKTTQWKDSLWVETRKTENTITVWAAPYLNKIRAFYLAFFTKQVAFALGTKKLSCFNCHAEYITSNVFTHLLIW